MSTFTSLVEQERNLDIRQTMDDEPSLDLCCEAAMALLESDRIADLVDVFYCGKNVSSMVAVLRAFSLEPQKLVPMMLDVSISFDTRCSATELFSIVCKPDDLAAVFATDDINLQLALAFAISTPRAPSVSNLLMENLNCDVNDASKLEPSAKLSALVNIARSNDEGKFPPNAAVSAATGLIRTGREHLLLPLTGANKENFKAVLCTAFAYSKSGKFDVLIQTLVQRGLSHFSYWCAAAALVAEHRQELKIALTSEMVSDPNAIQAVVDVLSYIRQASLRDEIYQQYGNLYISQELQSTELFGIFAAVAMKKSKNLEFGTRYLLSLNTPEMLLHNLSEASEALLPIFRNILPVQKKQDASDRLHDFLLKLNDEPLRLLTNKKTNELRFHKLLSQFDNILWGEVRNFLKPDRVFAKRQFVTLNLLDPNALQDLRLPVTQPSEHEELIDLMCANTDEEEFSLLMKHFIDGLTLREIAKTTGNHHSTIGRKLNELVSRLRFACDARIS